MKKYFVTLAVTASLCTQVAFANHRIVSSSVKGNDPLPVTAKNDNINSRIRGAFDKNFAGATYVKWQRVKGQSLAQAVFNYNNERFIAFFDHEGRLVATSRFIDAGALPLLVKKCINTSYAGNELVQIIELTQNDETTYIVTFDSERARFDVQIFNNGEHNVIKKEKKNLIVGL